MPAQNKMSAEQKAQVEEKLQKAANDGRVQCAAALGIAKKLAVSSREVGDLADNLKLKICKCQLNCF